MRKHQLEADLDNARERVASLEDTVARVADERDRLQQELADARSNSTTIAMESIRALADRPVVNVEGPDPAVWGKDPADTAEARVAVLAVAQRLEERADGTRLVSGAALRRIEEHRALAEQLRDALGAIKPDEEDAGADLLVDLLGSSRA